ncbi:MAG: hypothetical protein MJY98_02055 [Fibrobacter sp.]|nr:hypothetical protein [Fibrobacter sp.]
MGFGLMKAVMAFGLGLGLATQANAAARQMENLNRGLVSANVGNGMLVSWRLLGTDAPTTAFNLYRDGTKIATIGGSEPTNYLDAKGTATSKYTVAAVVNGVEGTQEGLSLVYDQTYKDGNSKISFPYKVLNLKAAAPANQTMPDGSTCVYSINDMSTGDLDGDGTLDLVIKWDPNNSKDNANSGYSGSVFIDGVKLDGTRLWRIDLGKNIRAGAHYTQFMVFDFDGDGVSEIAMKTSDGTVDGTGKVIGDASKDYRTGSGTIMSGNEFLTIFNGTTGAAINTINFWPARGKISGDNYGNRDNRMLAAVAYLDGVHPSLITSRGYYTEAYVAAYDFDGKKLNTKWQYSASTAGQGLYGQGNHNLSVADVDNDGKDEIIWGAGALDHDGTFMYRTGLGHGDAMHVSDMDPDRPGLEVWDVHEETNAAYSDELHTAEGGKIIWGTKQTGGDNGRGLAADLDSTNRGFEMWSYASGAIYTATGKKLWDVLPSQNFRIYFDGDLQDELLDAVGSPKAGTYAYNTGGKIDKWNQSSKGIDRYFSFYNVEGSSLNNYTKANPCLVADILGDWREELITRSGSDQNKIIIFSTAVTSPHRVYTLMHDSQYRLGIAWQNVAYNQPPHLSYYLPDNVGKNLKQPSLYTVGKGGAVVYPNSSSSSVISAVSSSSVTPAESSSSVVPASSSSEIPAVSSSSKTYATALDASTPDEGAGVFENTNAGWQEKGYYNFDNSTESFGTWNIYSKSATEATLTIRYANGGKAERNMNLTVNGEKVGEVKMGMTGAWTTWETVDVKVKLTEGKNVLTLSSITADGGANVDMLYFDKADICLYSDYESGKVKFEEEKTDNGETDEETNIASRVVKVRGMNSYNAVTGTILASEAGFAEVYYYDMKGDMKYGMGVDVPAGETMLKAESEILPKGMYFVKVKLNGRLIAKTKVSNF